MRLEMERRLHVLHKTEGQKFKQKFLLQQLNCITAGSSEYQQI